jgi:hypothetical protein
MKRRNFLAIASMWLIPIQKLFPAWGRRADASIDLTATQTIDVTAQWFPPASPSNTIKILIPRKTLASGETVTLRYCGKFGQWKEVEDHDEAGAAVALP